MEYIDINKLHARFRIMSLLIDRGRNLNENVLIM